MNLSFLLYIYFSIRKAVFEYPLFYNRFIGMIFRNESVISVVLLTLKTFNYS